MDIVIRAVDGLAALARATISAFLDRGSMTGITSAIEKVSKKSFTIRMR